AANCGTPRNPRGSFPASSPSAGSEPPTSFASVPGYGIPMEPGGHGLPSGCGPRGTGPPSVTPYTTSGSAFGKYSLNSLSSCGEDFADPIITVRTDAVSTLFSRSLRASTIAIIVGTPDMTVQR